jgi:MFS family permease
LGSFLIPAYIFPSIIVTLLAPRLAWRFGKKRVSFITAIIGSLILLAGGLIFPGGGFVIVVLLSSLFIEVSYPEIYAVFEDYVARLGVFGNDMVGLEGAAISLGFIAGPILAGILASFLGNQNAIVCFAGLFGLTAVLALSKVPRKIKMPQQELLEITIAKK